MDAVEDRLNRRAAQLSRELHAMGPQRLMSLPELRQRDKLVAQLHAVSTTLFLRRQMEFRLEPKPKSKEVSNNE